MWERLLEVYHVREATLNKADTDLPHEAHLLSLRPIVAEIQPKICNKCVGSDKNEEKKQTECGEAEHRPDATTCGTWATVPAGA